MHGIDERAGLTTPNLVEAETNRALIAAARRVLVVADHTQVGHRRALAPSPRCDQVDVLVTDADLDARHGARSASRSASSSSPRPDGTGRADAATVPTPRAHGPPHAAARAARRTGPDLRTA